MRYYEERSPIISKLTKQKKDLDKQINDIVLGVVSDESEEESVEDEAEQARKV